MSTRDELDILVVGGGSWGTTLASLLAGLGRKTLLWDINDSVIEEVNRDHKNSYYLPGFDLPGNLEATGDLEDGVKRAPVVLIVIPSQYFRSVAARVGDHIQGDQIVLHASKGIETETFKRMSQVLREETCSLKIGVISGPTLAVEIMAGHPAGATVASHYNEVVEKAQELFEGGRLRLYGGHDILGTELGGSFKNVIALAAGIADGLGFGNNTKALLVTRGLSEMIRFGVALGAEVFTFAGLAGIGDLMATCASPLSRNHTVGEELSKGRKLDDIIETMTQVAEGVPTTKAIHRQAMELGLDLPIVRGVYGVLYEDLAVKDIMKDLMRIPVGDELAALRYR